MTLFIEHDEGGVYDSQCWDLTVPSDWKEGALPSFMDRAVVRSFYLRELSVIVSAAYHGETAYIHASLSRKNRIPDYQDLCAVKEAIFGPTRYAAMILPPTSQHVNIHPNCLHLWGPVNPEDWPLPEFSRGMGTI